MFCMHCPADGCTHKGPRFFKREAKAAITTCSPLWGEIGEAAGSERNGKQKGRGKNLSLHQRKDGLTIKLKTQANGKANQAHWGSQNGAWLSTLASNQPLELLPHALPHNCGRGTGRSSSRSVSRSSGSAVLLKGNICFFAKLEILDNH